MKTVWPDLRFRRRRAEILDDPSFDEAAAIAAYRQVWSLESMLGVKREVYRRIRSHQPHPLRVLDVGCGDGSLLQSLALDLHLSVAGADIRPLSMGPCGPHVYRLNATADRLPRCDIALAVFMAHHLDEQGVVGLIANARRSADRLILVDLVRHWLPHVCFRALLSPWLRPVVAEDGLASIENSFTPAELGALARAATGEAGAVIEHRVAALRRWQLLDIRFASGARS